MWIFLAILAPALYGLSNFFDRFIIEKRIKNPLVLTALGGVLTFAFGLIIWIIQLFPILPGSQIVILLIAGLLFEIALIPWYKALSLDDASRVAPLFQSVSIFVLILSYFIIGEKLNSQQLLGFIFILIGGFILSVNKFDKKIFSLRPSFWYMMLSSFLFALPIVLFRLVIIQQTFWPTLGYELMGALLGTIIIIIYLFSSSKSNLLVKLQTVRLNTWLVVGINEIIYLAARFCSFLAISLAPVALVSALGGTQPLFMLIFGIVLSIWFPKFIKEDIRQKIVLIKIVSIALIFIGAYLINF